MELGDTVIVLNDYYTVIWEIAGCQGYIEYIDCLGNLYIRISGYPRPFVLTVDDVAPLSESTLDVSSLFEGE